MFKPHLEPHFLNNLILETVDILRLEADGLGIKLDVILMPEDLKLNIDKLRT
jgi:hypothetical protein